LGCGSGRHFTELDGELYAADFSKNLLSFAKKKAKNFKTKINLIETSAEELPFKDNFFDSAIFIRTLHCIDSKIKREKAMQELYRVIKPKAQVLIETWSKNHERVKNKPKECLMPWTVNEEKLMRYTYIYDKEELEEQLKKIGFKINKIWIDDNINMIVEK
jgi:ubiquinone/menaquinone biosynthesis C-methylase UbiE